MTEILSRRCPIRYPTIIRRIKHMIINNGLAVVIVAYFLFRDWKFHDNLQVTLTTLIETVDALKELINSKSN